MGESMKRIEELIAEADQLPKERYETGYIPEDVVVLVIDRASIEFNFEPNAMDYTGLRIKDNPYILAVAGFKGDEIRQAHRPLREFPNRLMQKAMLGFKMLIGGFGIYAFQRIWNLTVPESWRNQTIDPTPGKIR